MAVVFLGFDAYPQPVEYHDFADKRLFLGLPNFWNVASNVLFLAFGVQGIWLISTNRRCAIVPELRTTYATLFTGITMTAFGSGWFHFAPDNNSLFWDRLPMTIAFMPLFTVILGEHVSIDLARRLSGPLLFVGVGSVLYWDYTESLNAGDLRLYGLVQFLPMLLIPAILLTHRSIFDSSGYYWLAIGLYVLAKVLEQLDVVIFNMGEIISGHTLKHFIASLVPLVLIKCIQNRVQKLPASSVESQTTS